MNCNYVNYLIFKARYNTITFVGIVTISILLFYFSDITIEWMLVLLLPIIPVVKIINNNKLNIVNEIKELYDSYLYQEGMDIETKLALAQQKNDIVHDVKSNKAQNSLRCIKCKEPLDDGFDICWSCGAIQGNHRKMLDNDGLNSIASMRISNTGTGKIATNIFLVLSKQIASEVGLSDSETISHLASEYTDIDFIDFDVDGILFSLLLAGANQKIDKLESEKKKNIQQARDLVAERMIKQHFISDLTNEFAIYLRPFSITEQLYISLDEKLVDTNIFSISDKPWDLEVAIADSFWPILPFIGLGEPTEAYGTGRAFTKEINWKHYIKSMIDSALFIIIVPSFKPGTLWEMNYIVKNDYLKKCLFVMPWQTSSYGMRDWEKTQKCTADIGIELPGYTQDGAIFVLNDNIEWLIHENLKVLAMNQHIFNAIVYKLIGIIK